MDLENFTCVGKWVAGGLGRVAMLFIVIGGNVIHYLCSIFRYKLDKRF